MADEIPVLAPAPGSSVTPAVVASSTPTLLEAQEALAAAQVAQGMVANPEPSPTQVAPDPAPAPAPVPPAPPKLGQYEFKVGGKVVDVSGSIPLSVFDLQLLEKHPDPEVRLSLKQLQAQDLNWSQLAELAYILVRKADPSIPKSAVQALPLGPVTNLATMALLAEAPISRPT